MGGQTNESNESGGLEIQRRRFVVRLILDERFRNILTDLKKFLLAKSATIRLGWNSLWLRCLVKLDLVVSHSLNALFENAGSLPSLQALNVPTGPDPPSVSGKEIYDPKIPKYEQLYMAGGFPGVLSFKSLGEGPAVLLQHNPLWKKGSPFTSIISISCHGKLEDVHIKPILKKCIVWLKSGNRLVVIVRRNPVSKELDRLDIIFNQLSGIDLLAFNKDGRDTILILAELPKGPFYLPEEAPLRRAMYSVFLIYHGRDVNKRFIRNFSESLGSGGVYAVDIDLNKWEIEREKCSDVEQGWDRTEIHIPIISRHYEDSFSRHLGEFFHMCRSKCLIKPLFYEVEQTDILDIRMLYKSCFSVVATPACSSSGEINEDSPSRAGRPPQMSFQTGWSLSDYRSVKQLVTP